MAGVQAMNPVAFATVSTKSSLNTEILCGPPETPTAGGSDPIRISSLSDMLPPDLFSSAGFLITCLLSALLHTTTSSPTPAWRATCQLSLLGPPYQAGNQMCVTLPPALLSRLSFLPSCRYFYSIFIPLRVNYYEDIFTCHAGPPPSTEWCLKLSL